MIESLTQLEPQAFNYLAFHADKESQRELEVHTYQIYPCQNAHLLFLFCSMHA